jgi:excisionase family DNA binding protein
MQPLHAAPIAFSVAEAAELLGCSTDTVRRMIASGRVEGVQPLGKLTPVEFELTFASQEELAA